MLMRLDALCAVTADSTRVDVPFGCRSVAGQFPFAAREAKADRVASST